MPMGRFWSMRLREEGGHMAEKQHDEQIRESQVPESNGLTISRRGFLKGIGTGAVTAAVAPAVIVSMPDAARAAIDALPGVTEAQIPLKVNGRTHTVHIEARTTLATVLRDHLDLTGTKVVCDRGECGACTVLIDGKLAYSCMTLAIDMQGREITTIERLSDGSKLHPIQEAFIEKDATMCGYCTPGFVMAVKSVLDAHPNPTIDQIKRGVSGNICRCGTYPRVFEAALAAAQKMRNGG